MTKTIRTVFLPFIAIAITAGAIWFTNGSVTPKEATWEDVQAEAKLGGYLIINTEDLWKRYNKNPDKLFLVDTRQEWEYRTGHIKGALNFPMEPTWFSRWRKKGDLEALLGSDKDRFIVFY
jgi:3-mercaptopyruvate sulfurtransferase SseA